MCVGRNSNSAGVWPQTAARVTHLPSSSGRCSPPRPPAPGRAAAPSAFPSPRPASTHLEVTHSGTQTPAPGGTDNSGWLPAVFPCNGQRVVLHVALFRLRTQCHRLGSLQQPLALQGLEVHGQGASLVPWGPFSESSHGRGSEGL